MAGLMRDAPLTKEEQEEEEMRHELKDAGLYEDNMDLQEMRDLVQVVNASKNASYMNVDTSPVSSPSISKSQSTPEASKAIMERPIPSFSYSNAVQANDMATAGSSRKKEKSPESVYEFESNTNQTDSPSNEKNSNLKSDDFPELFNKSGSNNNLNDGPRLRSYDRKKPAVPIFKKVNVEKWKLNPYEVVNNGDYKPPIDLEQANLKINTEYYNDEFLESEKFQEMYEQISKEMDKLHDQFIEAEIAKHTENQMSWGSPIKVATKSGWNGSLDKNLSKEKQESAGRVTTRSTHERATKRKALNTIAAVALNDSSYENSNADDSEEEFVESKKRKCQQAKKGEETLKKGKEGAKSKAAATVDNNFEMMQVDKDNALKEKQPSDFEVFDNSELHTLRKSGTHNNLLQKSKIIEDRPQYPIRVLPPNPAKKSNKGPRAKNNKKNNQENNYAIKKKMGISDEEITNLVNTIDEHIDNNDNNDNDCIDITDEIKLSSITKPLQRKLQLAQSHLKSAIDEEDQRNKNEERMKKKKEEEEAQKKNETVKKRLKEIADENKLKDEKEKKFQEKQDEYKNILNSKQGRVTRANIKKALKLNYEDIDEDTLLAGDDDEPMITHASIMTKSLCPICQKSFPSDKIEEHASECDAFSINDEININTPSTSYDDYFCNICKKFRTNNGHIYEEHIIMCKQEAEDKRTGIYA